MRDACADAGVAPEEIGFVEAHGTGTAVGDPIEAHALAEALCVNRPADAPLAIGSIKTNLGHLETAAGIAGLLKAMLVLKHGQIPPSLHFETPSPHIDFEKLKLRVPTALEPFPDGQASGWRASIRLDSAARMPMSSWLRLPRICQTKSAEMPADRPWPLVLSARSEKALRDSAAKLSAWMTEHANANGSSPVLPDLTYTLGVPSESSSIPDDAPGLEHGRGRSRNSARLRAIRRARKSGRPSPRVARNRRASASS